MSNDYVLAEAIRLIKSGKKDAARVILEPFLLKNPTHIQAWMWEVEISPSDNDKIRVLESCLEKNPGNPQVIQALNFLKSRAVKPSAATSTSASPFSTDKPKPPPPAAQSPKRPAPPSFDEPPATTSSPFSASPFSTSPFLNEFDVPPAADLQTKSTLPPPPQFDIMEPGQKSAPGKKPKRKQSKTSDILIVAGACLVFALLAGAYMGGGFYLNQQINKSFAQQQCKDVVQYNYFVSLYPRGIFSSAFTGYDQYSECRLKLDADQSLEAQNWEAAVTLAQQYLAAHPNGSFAVSMNEQVINALSAWSKQLIANKDYSGGIDKLQQLVEAYPASPIAESARDEILQAYLTWTKELADKQSYSEAEQNLKSALTYFQADSARAAKIKDELVNVYISWGDMLVGIGNLDNAIKYYQQAGEVSQGAVDTSLLIARAYLKQATDMADKNEFNRALAKVKEITESAQTENIKVEANAAHEKILAAYSNSNSQEGTEQIATAISLICSKQRPELPIFGLDQKNIRFGLVTLIPMKLPKDLAAETPGQLHYVACTDEKETEIGTCPYTGGRTLHRLRYQWEITLYEVTTGNVFTTETLKGSNPPECKQTELFTKGVNYKKSYGSKPTLDQIVTWLKGLNISP